MTPMDSLSTDAICSSRSARFPLRARPPACSFRLPEPPKPLGSGPGYSICDHCNHVPSCGIKFHARGNVIESIENWKEDPRHILCSKGLATLQRLYNPNRLLHPMKRTNPKGSEDPGFVRCSWEEAYRMIAENLLRIRKQYGADSVMFYAGDPKEPRPPIIRLARHFGSVHWAEPIVGRLPRRLHAGRAAHLGPSAIRN